ncbi:cellulose biosynthesis protein BcsR [Pseudomonas graminis]
MKSKNQRPALQPDREQPDDISALRDAFSLTAFRYIDIARQERLAAIHARWPLLAELDALHKKEQ